MFFEKEREIFQNYISSKGLKHSQQRLQILEIFLKTERHLTADELYGIAKKENPSIGNATIYRTLKLFCDCGISSALRLEDGTIKYEHLYGHRHHDHLICMKCWKIIEVVDPEIEKLQERLAKKEGFDIKRHRLQIYGLCRQCKSK